MQEKNRCFRRSHLSEAKFRVIIRSFALDFLASKIAELSDVSRPTINKLLLKLRIRVAQVCDASSPFSGEVEVDESYFARRVRGKKGRGAGGKPIVFGILERQGKVYTEIAPDSSKKQRQAAIRGQAALEASSARTAGEATMGCRCRGRDRRTLGRRRCRRRTDIPADDQSRPLPSIAGPGAAPGSGSRLPRGRPGIRDSAEGQCRYGCVPVPIPDI